MQTKPAPTFRFSIAALLVLTAGVAFLASILIDAADTEPPTQPLVANTLPFHGPTRSEDYLGTSSSLTHAEMERLIETRMSSLHQSLAEAIAKALGVDTDIVGVSRIEQNETNGSFTIVVRWRNSSTSDVLILHSVAPNLYRTTIRLPDGSPKRTIAIDLTGTALDAYGDLPTRG